MINKNDRYVHPDSEEIRGLVKSLGADTSAGFIENLLAWFGENISYSRIEHPFYPLQRSDLDLLDMRCGTCGDFSNLIVSCLIAKGIPARYALIGRDCYGDPQDHICAAAEIGGIWVLIDATLPYRKWFGFGCPHREFELVEPDEFERRMRKIENDCVFEARSRMIPGCEGLIYAPWIHDEVVLETEDRLDSCFYMFSLSGPRKWGLGVTYMSYTREKGRTPIFAMKSPYGDLYRFSVREPGSIWDPDQWGEPYLPDAVPEELRTPEFERLRSDMEKNVPRILMRTRMIADPTVIID